MQRRDPAALVPGPEQAFDPLARFFELEAVFGHDENGGLFGDPVALRYAVANLLLCPGEVGELEAAVRATLAELRGQISWTASVPATIWAAVATVLVQRGDSAGAFAAELEQTRQTMRRVGVRRHDAYELIATLVLRLRNHLAPITAAQVEGLRGVYEQMKRHHWLLTGPEDLPACALLAASAHEPETVGARANAIYEGMRARELARAGDPLQTASHVLALGSGTPEALVERYATVVGALADVDIQIHRGEYDEVATLCLLSATPARIAEAVCTYQAAIRSRLHWGDRSHTVPIAANLAFVRLLGEDPELDVLADAKVLLDLQSMLAAAG